MRRTSRKSSRKSSKSSSKSPTKSLQSRKSTIMVGGKPFEYLTALPINGTNKAAKNVYERLDLQPNQTLQAIFKEGRTLANEKLTSNVSPVEGFMLYDMIKKNNLTKCLEVGMANGISALYMLAAGANLTSIDPFQSRQWHNAGINHVKAAGFDGKHNLIAKKSYEALPALVAEKLTYDLIFIDGMHLFDYTLIDVFYAILLCRIGGIIVIDDVRHAAPAKCIKYINSNYKCLKPVSNTIGAATTATYIKIREDAREWNFHRDF